MCLISREVAGGPCHRSASFTPDAFVADLVAIVLARGLGRRMREENANASIGLTDDQRRAAAAGVKSLVPMSSGGRSGRPFLDYLLSGLADVGIEDVALVIGPEHGDLRAHYEHDRAPRRLRLSFVIQQEPLGTADAVRAAETFAAGRAFLSLNADNLYPAGCLRALIALDGPGLPGFERDELIRSSAIPASRVGSFALLDVGADGTLRGIVEKPGVAAMAAAGAHALVSMNVWRFDERIFAACRDVPRSPRGEFELPEAVRLAIQRGVRFTVVPARGPVLDLSRREDIPSVAAQLARHEVQL
jgi:glucose-1-phosphate thymidylyltransferase